MTQASIKVELLSMPGVFLPGTFWGPSTVWRSNPFPYVGGGGQEAIQTKLLTLGGYVDNNPANGLYDEGNELVAGDGEALVPMVGNVGGIPATMNESETKISPGMIIDTNPDAGDSFPARSFFDIFFEVSVAGFPILHNNDPLRMESTIDSVPPDIWVNKYVGTGWVESYYAGNPDAQVFDLPLKLYDPNEVWVANLTEHPIHQPEPAALGLLAIGGLVLLRRR
jgi:hypothetical protein